jgi:NADH-quinone oxidoreductase subunit A
MPQDYIPVLIQTLIVLGFVITTMVVTHFLGPKRYSRAKLENFECGIEGLGNARSPFSVKYFLIAILFVLFDVEVIFMYPWAVKRWLSGYVFIYDPCSYRFYLYYS